MAVDPTSTGAKTSKDVSLVKRASISEEILNIKHVKWTGHDSKCLPTAIYLRRHAMDEYLHTAPPK